MKVKIKQNIKTTGKVRVIPKEKKEDVKDVEKKDS